MFGRTTPPATPRPGAPNGTTPAPAFAPPPPQQAPAQQTAQAAPPPPAPTPSAISASSILGDDVAIVGERITIVSKARIQIDGEIQGNINGQEVVVGPNGRVDGTITARKIEVRGAVYGALKASSVTLQPTAKVEGDIHNESLAISEGAIFDGRVRRPKEPGELEPNLDVAALRNAIAQHPAG
ncbi:MAG: polymer-forming cytoskeletal protein [Pseudomonadota bacterium]